jgi:glycosyltransferase involved in cell wall biosynthesis
MRIFYVARLFSGLESSFITKKWSPTGVPTIYRIIEKIDKEHDTCFVFTAKDSGLGYFSSWQKPKDKILSIDGLSHDINIISGINFFPTWVGTRVSLILREIRQIVLVLYKIYKFKPDILYCDHANVLIAAIFSRMQKKIPVVFRVMGVNQFMRTSISSPKIYRRIYKWAYKSPFSFVICTQDGSGVEKWASRALALNVKRKILLNGVDSLVVEDDMDPKLNDLPHDKVIVMFVGKLEEYKGCCEFVRAILNIAFDRSVDIHALVIGSGTKEKEIIKVIDNEGAGIFFTFIGLLPHSQILHAHSICDIYVSMNHLGNLSNANLEAIQSNDCMVISAPQKDKEIDVVTASLLESSVVSVPINQPDELSKELLILVKSKSKRDMMARKIKKIKKNFIWTWDERIDAELDILKKINIS